MRIINVLLLVSLCYLVGAKYLPEESASRALLRNVRSTRNELHITQESQSNESNDDDDDNDDDNDNNDDDKSNSLEKKRQEQIEKLERKRVEEQRKLQERRVKEDRKRQEMLEKEQKRKEKIEAKFEEEKRKLEEKLQKEKRKRAEKLAEEERKRAEKLAEEEQKRQEKIAKEERKQQQKIAKQLNSLSKTTVSSQHAPITSNESEEDMDLEDIWKNYVYEKYGLLPTSTNIEKKAAVNRYMQEELGLNANSTKAEYRQAVLQLVQNRLVDQQSPSNSKSSFQNYLLSHVNAIDIQKLQVEIESKIAELENDTILLQNISVPWASQAKHTIQQKKTILTSIAQFLSSILPNWITGSNSSSSTDSSNSNVVSSISGSNPPNAESVQVSSDGTVINSGSLSDSTTTNGVPINVGSISSIDTGSSGITGGNNPLDYNNPDLINTVTTSNSPVATSNINSASTVAPSVENNELAVSGQELAGSVTEGFLTNDEASISDQANNYASTSTGTTKPANVLDTTTVESVALNGVIASDSSLVISTGVGASSDSASPSPQSASSNIVTTGTEASISLVSSGTDVNLIVPIDTSSTNVEGLGDSNVILSNADVSPSSISSASPTITEIPTSDAASPNSLQVSDTPKDEVTSPGSETIYTNMLGVLENNNIDANTDVPNPSLNSSETSNNGGIIEQSSSGSSNTVTVEPSIGVEAPITAVDSILGVEFDVAGSTDTSNISGLAPNVVIVGDTIPTPTELISSNTSPNDVSATSVVENSINTSTVGEASPTVTDVAVESATNKDASDTPALINNEFTITQGTDALDVVVSTTGIATDNKGDSSPSFTEASVNKTDLISTVEEASTFSSPAGIINTVENLENILTSGTDISTPSPIDTGAPAIGTIVENTTNIANASAIENSMTNIFDSGPTIITAEGTSTNTDILADNSLNVAATGVVPSVTSSSDYPAGSSSIPLTNVEGTATSESGIESTLSGSTDVINTQGTVSEDKIIDVIETTNPATETIVENVLNTSDNNVFSNSTVTVVTTEKVAVNTIDTASVTVDTISATTVTPSNAPEAVATGQGDASALQNTAAPVDVNAEGVGVTSFVATEQVAVNTIDPASVAVDTTSGTIVASSDAPEAIGQADLSAQQVTAAPIETNVEGASGASYVTMAQVSVNTINTISNAGDTVSATTVASSSVPADVGTGQENASAQNTTVPVDVNLEGTTGINTNTEETLVASTIGADVSATPTSYVPNTVNEAVVIESVTNEGAAAGTNNPKNPIGQDSITSIPQTVVTEVVPLASETVVNIVEISTATEKVIATVSNVESQTTDVAATAGYQAAGDINLVTTETVGIAEASLATENNIYTPTIPEEIGASLLEVTEQ